jgi:hypothetical protein
MPGRWLCIRGELERAMDIPKEAAERLVLRRVVTGGVVAESYHPAIGPSVLVIRRQLGLQCAVSLRSGDGYRRRTSIP